MRIERAAYLPPTLAGRKFAKIPFGVTKGVLGRG